MKTQALLITLRETFFQLQSVTASVDTKHVIGYYEEAAVKQPLIVNLHTVYREFVEQAGARERTWHSDALKLQIYAPVAEQVLLTFCQQYEHMLKPPKPTEITSAVLVLPYGCCTLPLRTLEDCVDVYLSTKPVWLNTGGSFYDLGSD
jgi:hypothetical protein